jgi:hypothetical protein
MKWRPFRREKTDGHDCRFRDFGSCTGTPQFLKPVGGGLVKFKGDLKNARASAGITPTAQAVAGNKQQIHEVSSRFRRTRRKWPSIRPRYKLKADDCRGKPSENWALAILFLAK